MHYGTFQLSAESLTEPVKRLEQAKQKANIGKQDFITLDIGKPVDIHRTVSGHHEKARQIKF